MEHEIPHALTLPEARNVVRSALASYTERLSKYHPEVKWTGEDRVAVGFNVKGMHLNGTLDIEPDKFRLQLAVPLLLRPFTAQATKVIDREAAGWITKARTTNG
ncbi:MAG TPA: polyhydroxyalkanoic acid system family protein [Polyangiales bacterium]|jgi:hypothetical protein|nr:polyhydroxyalkanoic acid system family protein [Polyangiales bacterium]